MMFARNEGPCGDSPSDAIRQKIFPADEENLQSLAVENKKVKWRAQQTNAPIDTIRIQILTSWNHGIR